MDFMGKPQPGVWYLKSEKDPRWNSSGNVGDLTFSAGNPPEVTAELERLKAEFGELPDDLEFFAMKD